MIVLRGSAEGSDLCLRSEHEQSIRAVLSEYDRWVKNTPTPPNFLATLRKDLRKLRASDQSVCYDAVTSLTEYFCQNACSLAR
jgi:hypothetical protein